jgi:hypothetical protein
MRRMIFITLALSACGATTPRTNNPTPPGGTPPAAAAWPTDGVLGGWSCFQGHDDKIPVVPCYDTAAQCEESKMDGTTCKFTREAYCYLAGDAMDCWGDIDSCKGELLDSGLEGASCEVKHKASFTCWSGTSGKDTDSSCTLFPEECAADQKGAEGDGVKISQPCAARASAFCAGDVMDTCGVTMQDCQNARKDDDPPCAALPTSR